MAYHLLTFAGENTFALYHTWLHEEEPFGKARVISTFTDDGVLIVVYADHPARLTKSGLDASAQVLAAEDNRRALARSRKDRAGLGRPTYWLSDQGAGSARSGHLAAR